MGGLVEKVAEAIKNVPYWAYGEWGEGEPESTLAEFYESTWQADNAPHLFPAAARAAIEAVFDALAEQGEAAASEIEYPGSKRTAADYWPIMLATLRKQALG